LSVVSCQLQGITRRGGAACWANRRCSPVFGCSKSAETVQNTATIGSPFRRENAFHMSLSCKWFICLFGNVLYSKKSIARCDQTCNGLVHLVWCAFSDARRELSLVIGHWHEAGRPARLGKLSVPKSLGLRSSHYADVDHGLPKEPKKTMKSHILIPRNEIKWLVRSISQMKC
jgi:hypothetical protein